MADDLLSKIGMGPSLSEVSLMRGAAQLNQLSAKAQKTGANGLKGSGLQNGVAAGPDSPAKIKEAAEDFEALLLQQMFKSMWAAVPQENLLSGGREGEYFRDMFTEGLAKDVSKGQGIGIKEIIVRELTARSDAAKIDGEGEKE